MESPPVSPVDSVDSYDFASPMIHFGRGRVAETGVVAGRFGHAAWLVTGGRPDAPAAVSVAASLTAAGMPFERIASAAGEPTVADVATGLARIRGRSRNGVVVVAVGGGAAIDLAKAIAALATNGLDESSSDGEAAGDAQLDSLVIDHLEGVGRGLAIERPPLPLVAVPTTAGTGAEATRNAVISCPRRRFKKSLRSPLMVPRAAIVDPDTTATCPPGVVAACGIDCITQLIEAYVCRFRRPLPMALVRESLPGAVRSLPIVVESAGVATNAAEVLQAREAMSHAALCSGLALANSGLGLAHGVAAALGIECGTPHGVACGLMLPVAMRVNRDVARDDFASLERLLDPLCRGDDDTAADRFLSRIERLCRGAGLPASLRDIGLERGRLEWLATNSGGASMRGNPVEMTPGRLLEVLEAAYG